MKKTRYFSATIVAVSLFVAILNTEGCKKEKETAATSTTSATYDFSWFGNQYVGRTITFNTTAPAGSSVSWDYGDGTGAISGATHVYGALGRYQVTMTINGDTANAVTKTINVGVCEPRILTLPTAVSWHHSLTTRIGGADTVIYYSDTAFYFTVIDPLTLVVGSDTLNFFLFYATTTGDTLLEYLKTTHPTTSQNRFTFSSSSDTMYYYKILNGSVDTSIEMFTTP